VELILYGVNTLKISRICVHNDIEVSVLICVIAVG